MLDDEHSLSETGENADELHNISCAEFCALSEREQRIFVLGVANGRSMTAGLFQAYSGAAEDWSDTEMEKAAIIKGFDRVRHAIEPVLNIDANSLLNGIKAASTRSELRERFIIEALASMHVDVVKALRQRRDNT